LQRTDEPAVIERREGEGRHRRHALADTIGGSSVAVAAERRVQQRLDLICISGGKGANVKQRERTCC